MDKQTFPIRQGVACNNKWTWSTLWLARGTTASCHRVRPHNISLSDFNNFHNTPEKLLQRRMMLDGQWPDQGCEYCRNIESVGGKSDRMNSNEISNWIPKELEQNQLEINVTPKVVEIFISNTCQLKCLYCDPGLSSSIQKENAEHGEFSVGTSQGSRILLHDFNYMLPEKDQYFIAFMAWLDRNHRDIRRLHVLGGEPFLQSEMTVLIDFFETHPSPELELNIVSNLMIKQRNMERYIDRLADLANRKHLRFVHVTGSIDTWGVDAEYVRNGLDLNVFESNMRYLLNNSGIGVVGIYQVITCLTLGRAHELYEKIIEWRQIRPKLQYYFQLNTDWNRDFLHPKHWGTDHWDSSYQKLVEKMSLHNDPMLSELDGIWKTIKTGQRDQIMINMCYKFLDELDRRRGTQWRQIWDYL